LAGVSEAFPQSRVLDSPSPTRDQESEDAAVDGLFRAIPSPPEAVEDPVQDVIDEGPVPAMPEVPEVSPEVQRAAKALALRVWSSGSSPRARLFAGMLPIPAEQYLNHAVAMKWVNIDGDRIAPGPVNPRPMEALPSEHPTLGDGGPYSANASRRHRTVIVDGTLDDALEAAIDHALLHHIPTVIRRQSRHLVSVIPDTSLIELLANNTPLAGGTVRYCPDGRSVLVIHEREQLV
jgi:hypothetical protein